MCHSIYNNAFAGNLSQLTIQALGKTDDQPIEKGDVELSPLRVTVAAVVGLVSLYFITVGSIGFFRPDVASLIFPSPAVTFTSRFSCSVLVASGAFVGALFLAGLHATQDDRVVRAKSYPGKDHEWFCFSGNGNHQVS